MLSISYLIILELAVISCAMISGFFLTFSDFLMRSLKKADAPAGIQVMQIINREVWKSIIMVLLWGMVILSVLLALYAYLKLVGTASTLIIGGSFFYFTGVLIVSYAVNVPMNNELDSMENTAREAVVYWNNSYVPRWIFWNYIRAFASAGAAICFLIASILLASK